MQSQSIFVTGATGKAGSREAFAVTGAGAAEEFVRAMDCLFSGVIDGRNSHLADGVQRPFGRPANDFGDFSSEAVSTGLWRSVL